MTTASQGRLERRDIPVLTAMFGTVVLLHIVGFGMLFAVVNGDFTLNDGKVFGVGLGITAYTLGMRHAFDADHIAAIDNTTRSLVTTNKRPLTVGFWFSLGHSTIVFVMCVLLVFGIKSLARGVGDDNSTLKQVTGIWGTSVSGLFLLAIGVLNLLVLIRIARIFFDLRKGVYNEAELEKQLDNRGFLNRFIGKGLSWVRRPVHMYPVGVLFGLGFDTATEVSLLVLAGAAAVNLPWYAILCLPILFTAGMSLFDSMDGAFMNYAYGWANDRPIRRIFYNGTVTALSVAVALLIGGIELIGLLANQLDITTGVLGAIGAIDLEGVGYIVVGLFVFTWAGAVALWRFGRIEERWTGKHLRGE